MSRKRRDFAIQRPPVADPVTQTTSQTGSQTGSPDGAGADQNPQSGATGLAPGSKDPHQRQEETRRRSPMAAAVRETAEAARARAEQAAEIRAENDALAAELVRLKRAGLVTDLVPLDAIVTRRLTRDRASGKDVELPELVASIRAVGLSNPIRLTPDGAGRFELVEGWRRLSAYRQLLQDSGDPHWSRIPAAMVPVGKTLSELYRRMVDENLVRRGISFAEMAELARSYANDPETDAGDVDAAVTALYQSAGYQKRSYIRAFAELLDWIGPNLRHAAAIPRKLGLDLRRLLESDPAQRDALRDRLYQLGAAEAEAELALLRAFVAAGQTADAAHDTTDHPADHPADHPTERSVQDVQTGIAAALPRGEGVDVAATRGARTFLRIDTAAGPVRISASQGRVEIRADRDFSRTDQQSLEAGLRAFLSALPDTAKTSKI